MSLIVWLAHVLAAESISTGSFRTVARVTSPDEWIVMVDAEKGDAGVDVAVKDETVTDDLEDAVTVGIAMAGIATTGMEPIDADTGIADIITDRLVGTTYGVISPGPTSVAGGSRVIAGTHAGTVGSDGVGGTIVPSTTIRVQW